MQIYAPFEIAFKCELDPLSDLMRVYLISLCGKHEKLFEAKWKVEVGGH